LLLKKINEKTKLEGDLILNKSIIKDNIFSNRYRDELFNSSNPNNFNLFNNFNIDVSIRSWDTIEFKTKYLQSSLNLDFRLIKEDTNIDLLGEINLLNGKILLPYKELKIIQGKIKFLENEISNPFINLIAKNTIGENAIQLQVHGNAQNPKILLEANPKLTQEQIISLLLFGSKDYSISLMIPAFLIDNIKNIVLSDNKYVENLHKYFKVLLKPFKYIKFIPQLNSEDKNIIAKVELDINERLNACVEKKIKSQQKSKVKLNYNLTDNLSLQALHDESGNLSSDIEFKCKF